jgi:hypothetical protein
MSRDVHSCTHWLRPRNHNPPLPPQWDSYMRALLISKHRRHLFETPWSSPSPVPNSLVHITPPQSTELTRGPPDFVQHFPYCQIRVWLPGVHEKIFGTARRIRIRNSETLMYIPHTAMCVRCNGRWACVTVSLVDFQVLRSAVPENRHHTLPVYYISPVKHIGFQRQLEILFLNYLQYGAFWNS